MPTFPYDVNIDAATVALGAFALCRREAGFAQGARSSKVQLLSALVDRRLFSLLENCFTSLETRNESLRKNTAGGPPNYIRILTWLARF